MTGKKLFRYLKAANLKYNMIQNGDRVAVGVSGGKDSLALLYGLYLLKKYTPLNFEVIPVSIDLGWNHKWQSVTDFCASLSFSHVIVNSQIGPLVFETRQEKNPCALCANLRSGALHRQARELKCNKVALAHHLDDALTTLFMSMMFEGQFRTFKPVTYLDRSELFLIRPLIYVEERTIIGLSDSLRLPVTKNPCPVSGQTNREVIKEFLNQLEDKYPYSRRRMLKALENVDRNSFWDTEDLRP